MRVLLKNFQKTERLNVKKKRENMIKAQQAMLFNKKRVAPAKHQIDDLMAIKRIQFLPLSKLKFRYLGPYCVTDRADSKHYMVLKVGYTEGSIHMSTRLNFMQKWRYESDQSLSEYEEDIEEIATKENTEKISTEENTRVREEVSIEKVREGLCLEKGKCKVFF